MKREDLAKLLEGLEEESRKSVVDKIMELHGKDIESHKSKVETAESSATEIQKQLDAANGTIEEMKKLNPEDLQKKADEWKANAEKYQQEAEQAKKDADTKLVEYQFNSALTDALRTAKVKDPSDVLPHIKRDEVIFKDGQIVDGLERQLTALKESKDYLFNSENPELKIVTKSNGGSGPAMSALEAAVWKGSGLKPPTNE